MFAQKYETLSRTIESWLRENPADGRLPGVRKFASMFGADKKTVGKAMRLLVRRGVIRVNGPQGTFRVARPGGSPGYHAIGILGIAATAGQEKLIDYLNSRSRKFGYKVVALDLKAEDYELLLHFPFDGYIFLGSYSTSWILSRLHECSIPVIGGPFFDFPWLNRVTYDHAGGYGALVKYLKQLGHRRIALVEYERKQEYAEYIAHLKSIFRNAMGDDFSEELFCIIPRSRLRIGFSGMEKPKKIADGIVERLMALRERPSAVIVVPPLVRHIFLSLKERGFSVPRDVSLVDVACIQNRNPGYTTLVAHEERLTAMAVRRMIAILDGSAGPPRTLCAPFTLKIGRSTMKCSSRS